jgi:Tol biopolymer transport system component
MKRLALALAVSVTCLAVVAIIAAQAIPSDTSGAESAGPVPNAVNLETCEYHPAPKRGDLSLQAELALKPPPAGPNVDYVIDLKSGAMTPLPESIIRTAAKQDESRPDLSPGGRYAASRDGSQLAYVGRGQEGSPQIFIARIDGTGVRQLTHDPQGAMSPAWSPDASMIAYHGSMADGAGALFVLDVDTGESLPLPEAGSVERRSEVQFTPDGSSLLYTSGSSSDPVLRTIPIDGGKSTVFMGRDEGMADSGNGSLSPDGSLVTMMGSETCGPGAVRFVSNADGTRRANIPGRTSNPAGTWSPDGTRIVCVGWQRRVGVIVVDVATGKVSPVAEGTAAIWLDGHTLLVEAL